MTSMSAPMASTRAPQTSIRLSVGAEERVHVDASSWWNATALQVQPNETYALLADGVWYDADIEATAAGYTRLLLAPFGWARRARKANWFSLVAAVHSTSGLGKVRPSAGNFVSGWIDSCRHGLRSCDGASDLTDIGEHGMLTVRRAGHLYLFANDAFFAYCNNRGAITVCIKRLT